MIHTMKDICAEYGRLLDRFVNGGLSAEEFQAAYLEKFKSETRDLDDELYELLEKVFGDADSFTRNPELHAERPSFYLNERVLRERVGEASRLLMNFWH